MVYIDSERCTGCGACVEVCPAGAIRLVDGVAGGYAVVDQEKCQECEACLDACPQGAILSAIEPAVEGKLVPVESRTVPLTPQAREVQTVQPAPRALSWLGVALAFVGREIVPRVAVSLLDAWDRRASHPTPSPSDSISASSAQLPTVNVPREGGRQRRQRRRRGGR